MCRCAIGAPVDRLYGETLEGLGNTYSRQTRTPLPRALLQASVDAYDSSIAALLNGFEETHDPANVKQWAEQLDRLAQEQGLIAAVGISSLARPSTQRLCKPLKKAIEQQKSRARLWPEQHVSHRIAPLSVWLAPASLDTRKLRYTALVCRSGARMWIVLYGATGRPSN
jgi:hypothetical protein